MEIDFLLFLQKKPLLLFWGKWVLPVVGQRHGCCGERMQVVLSADMEFTCVRSFLMSFVDGSVSRFTGILYYWGEVTSVMGFHGQLCFFDPPWHPSSWPCADVVFCFVGDYFFGAWGRLEVVDEQVFLCV